MLLQDILGSGPVAIDSDATTGKGGPTDSLAGESKQVQAEAADQPESESKGKANGSGGDAKKGALVKEETREKGVVALEIYQRYAGVAGVSLTCLVVALACGSNAAGVVVNWWLGRWSSDSTVDVLANATLDLAAGRTTEYYLSIYACLSLVAFLVIGTFTAVTAVWGIGAARQIHRTMFRAVLQSPMSYFDTTPRGRLINRFSIDMGTIDRQLVTHLMTLMDFIFLFLAILALMVSLTVWVLIGLVPLACFYLWIQKVYRNSSRELKRLDSISTSPVPRRSLYLIFVCTLSRSPSLHQPALVRCVMFMVIFNVWT